MSIRTATAGTSLVMEPVPTVTALDLMSIGVNRTVTLGAKDTPAPATPVANAQQQPFYTGPSGTVRFFDGTLFLGSVTIPANTLSAPQVAFTTPGLAAGGHDLKAVFESPRVSYPTYAGSTTTLSVNLK